MARERAEKKRLRKKARVREQIESGSLVIGQMTEQKRRAIRPALRDARERPGGEHARA